MTTMKAAYLETTGAPEVIRYGDLPKPEPKAGEVCVRMGAASLNPIDTYIRSGMVKMALPMPFIPGCDVAGTVVAVGPSTSRFKTGDRVWGSNQGLLGRQGTFAEFVCAHEDFLYPTPANASDEQLAAIALTGITAHLGLFQCAKIQPDETVFVNGGTGGVGAMVVQMARAVGAHAITTVGSAEKAALAKDLGADCVINYKTEDVAAKVKQFTKDKGVQVWYETQHPDFDKAVELLTPRGRMIVMAGRQARPPFPNGPFYVKGLSLYGFAMFNSPPAEQRRCADDINMWITAEKLRALIGGKMRLSEAAAAHQLLEENTLNKAGTLSGKIVLVP
jgi:NADPH2:quinone reductase